VSQGSNSEELVRRKGTNTDEPGQVGSGVGDQGLITRAAELPLAGSRTECYFPLEAAKTPQPSLALRQCLVTED
jgi:hypothetical protein